ncbi:hypothetical protein PhCBS80983_g03906 [Powellomyces hirtus]|uniref:Thioredoxin domain-containing protein n=1 Tax=Powellomyces hirtus TaxID=109895 RepID=A0A507E2G6_9FUNG|nr:hypothetical protein PhCBS80983_g03906 [Powellomyces hirtus]
MVVEFHATWSGPCQSFWRTVPEFLSKYISVHLMKIDVDHVPDVAEQVGIESMPTFQLCKDGFRVGQVAGANAAKLDSDVRAHFPESQTQFSSPYVG